MRRTYLGAALAAALVLPLAACTADAPTSRVGVFMPTDAEEAWVVRGNALKTQLELLDHEVELYFAQDDVATQVSQLDAELAAGADLLIVGSIDGSALGAPLATAAADGVPVIAYDRLITGTADIDYYATFDNQKVGLQQGTSLLQGLGVLDELGQPTGVAGPFSIEVFAGSPDDNNASLFFEGAMSVLEPYLSDGTLVVGSGETAFETVATPGWDGETAGARMEGLLSKHYGAGKRVDAVLAPNDTLAENILAKAEAAGYGTDAQPWPVVTGQDAQLGAARLIRDGAQTSTIFKDSALLAEVVVTMGDALLKGHEPETNDVVTYDNGAKVVATYVLPPVLVTQDNYEALLLDSGFLDKAEL